jgi:chemotaxis signal transduction protein
VYRGDPVVALDLARCLGLPDRPLDVDAHMVVLATSRPVALVVDRVKALVEAPAVAEAPKDAPTWLSTPLVAALCRAEDELIPVLRTELLLEGLPQ